MDHDIYISCTEADRAVAASLAEYLEAQGMKCRIKAPAAAKAVESGLAAVSAAPAVPEDLEDTGRLLLTLSEDVEAIRAARVMVLVFTDSVLDSEEIMKDVSCAVDNGVTIIPFRLTDAALKGRLGFFLRPLHWLDAYGKDEAEAKAALADLCRTTMAPPKVTQADAGPESALLQKKNTRRNRILFIGALVLVGIIAAVVAYFATRPAKVGGTPIRDMTCDEFALAYFDNLVEETGNNDLVMYAADTPGVYYALVGTEEDGLSEGNRYKYLVVELRCFDEDRNPVASRDDHFYKIGLTNQTDNEFFTTQEAWTPHIRALLRTMYPDTPEERLAEILEELYTVDPVNGNSKVITADFIITYTVYEPMYLVEVLIQ